jgi:hypothetical protein
MKDSQKEGVRALKLIQVTSPLHILSTDKYCEGSQPRSDVHACTWRQKDDLCPRSTQLPARGRPRELQKAKFVQREVFVQREASQNFGGALFLVRKTRES